MKKYLADRLYESAENTNHFWLEGVGAEEEARQFLYHDATVWKLLRLYLEDVIEESITLPKGLGWVYHLESARLVWTGKTKRGVRRFLAAVVPYGMVRYERGK